MNDHTIDETMVLEGLQRIIDGEIAPRADELDRTGEFPWETVQALFDVGFVSPLLPQRYGGAELPFGLFVQMIERIAMSCASSALLLIAQADGLLPILYGGSEALKQRFLPRLASEPIVVAFAATEPQAGSDILSMRTRAVLDGDVYRVNGQKCFITNGSVAEFFTLYAYTDPSKGARGLSAFVVEKDTPGLSYGKNEDKMGMRGSVNSVLFFEDMVIPVDQRIGEEGDGWRNMMTSLESSRLFSAAQATGIAAGAYQLAREYARQRIQFSKPIAHLGVMRSLFADMATEVDAARLLTRRAAQSHDEGDPAFGNQAAMAKVYASDAAMRVTTDVVQVFGGYGYSREYPVERMMRDAKLTQIYTGTNQILRYIVGKGVLEGD